MASRIVGFLLPAANLFAFLTIAGVIALFTRHARMARIALVGVAVAYLLCGWGPLGTILIRPLEDCFPVPSDKILAPRGIIILGGGLRAQISHARRAVSLSEGGRLIETATLALRYPKARVVFSGFTSGVKVGEGDEAHEALKLLVNLGVSSARIVLETRSRNTDENSLYTRDLLRSDLSQQWILVTSAAHMPRAIGSFRHAGFNVVAYPTDHRTEGELSDYWRFHRDQVDGLSAMDAAVHEWVGLVVYRLAGKSDTLLPGPQRINP